MTGLLSPSFAHGKVEQKQPFVPITHTEPAILPPLQSSQPVSVESPSLPLPPLNGYVSPTQQQHPPPPTQYHHAQYGHYPSHMPDYGKPDHHQQQQQHYEGGMYALHHGQHGGGTPTTQMSPQVANTYDQNPGFIPDFNNFMPTTNDGFTLQLQQLMGTPWNAPDTTAPLYNQHHLSDMSAHHPPT